MSDNSKIEWTDATWNPVVGCSHVSEGCRNCYAEKMAGRLACMGQAKYQAVVAGEADDVPGKDEDELHYRGVWKDKVEFAEAELDKPLRWKKPRKIFVCSMGDLFHESVPDKWIDRVFAVMAMCPQHTFQVLTKRPERMAKYFSHEHRNTIIDYQYIQLRPEWTVEENISWIRDFPVIELPLPNCWLGVTCENQQRANERIPLLLQTPAAVRYVSVEPMLGPVDLTEIGGVDHTTPDGIRRPLLRHNSLKGHEHCGSAVYCYQPNKIDWVVCGAETGQGARPMQLEWARDLRDQCAAAGVPFFFKKADAKGNVPEDLMVRQWPLSGGKE